MTFTTDTATYDIIEGAHVVGLAFTASTDGYLMFQRSKDPDPDDCGVYIELNDQANSGYDLVRECRIDRHAVEIDLSQTLAGFATIHVKLAVDDDSFTRLLDGLKKIFRGCHDQVNLNE